MREKPIAALHPKVEAKYYEIHMVDVPTVLS